MGLPLPPDTTFDLYRAPNAPPAAPDAAAVPCRLQAQYDRGLEQGNGDPTILRKDAKTVMLVQDGETAVIGGIYQRNSGLSFSKVPFFGDLPFIGFFFRNRKENDDRAEFLVFITPRISNSVKRSTAFAP